MTVISNDPIWWPMLDMYRVQSYVIVASLTALVYDWALTIGQELELVWRQRWSLMTIIYLSLRYIGMPYTVVMLLEYLPSISLADAGCNILSGVQSWTAFVVNVTLGVIIITRLHAMYQHSRKMLIFLVVIFLAVQIAGLVIAAIQVGYISGVELILSGIHLCAYEDNQYMMVSVTWILGSVWEVLTLCLAVWISVKHMRELQGPAISDCFTVLIRSHVFYFTSFAFVSCLHLGLLSSQVLESNFVGYNIFVGVLLFSEVVQMFVLGPRLILGLREYHAKLVNDSDEGTAMTSMAFHEHVHISTGGGV